MPAFSTLKRAVLDRVTGGDRTRSVPAGQRMYAIGDIHGRADLLAELHRRIRNDSQGAPARVSCTVVYLGDYIDRGLNSKEVIDLLLDAPLEGFDSVHLKGNHEDALLRFLEDPSFGPEWFAIGGDATALSYGVRIPKGLSTSQRFEHVWSDLPRRIPDRHLEFLSGLELKYQVGDYVFVHAGIRPGVALDRQDPADLMWIRDEFLEAEEDYGKVIVHGHSPNRRPDIHDHRIGIDTGAYVTNVLTCLVIEGTDRRFLATGTEDTG